MMNTRHASIRARRGQKLLRQYQELQRYTDAELRAIGGLSTRLTLPAGSVLCREGRVGREAFLVLRGSASVTRGEQELAMVGQGDVVGEIALLDACKRTATVTATSPLEVLVFNVPEFNRVLREAPTLARQISATLAARLRAADCETATT
jgi:CRP-like cAMP-binding protein